jgi:Txe/YoeB family toxin of toxin-antitoxin system
VVRWTLAYSKQAVKDSVKLRDACLKDTVLELLTIIESNPYQTPPPYEKLVGDLRGYYSRRINIKHRMVYEVFKEERTVRILSMWSHYE